MPGALEQCVDEEGRNCTPNLELEA